jgi:hypothetical protein
MTDRMILTLGILGGTGKEGRGLAYRWAKAGYHVIVGSRQEQRAVEAAGKLNDRLGKELVEGLENSKAAEACDIAVLTVPYSAQQATLRELKKHLTGKMLVTTVAPIDREHLYSVNVSPEGSAAEQAQQLLGDEVAVVAAFQNVSHAHLNHDGPVPCDVLICGDSEAAKEQVLHMVSAAGLVGWDAGSLKNAVVVEGLTTIFMWINKHYEMKSAGLRITGEQSPA